VEFVFFKSSQASLKGAYYDPYSIGDDQDGLSSIFPQLIAVDADSGDFVSNKIVHSGLTGWSEDYFFADLLTDEVDSDSARSFIAPVSAAVSCSSTSYEVYKDLSVVASADLAPHFRSTADAESSAQLQYEIAICLCARCSNLELNYETTVQVDSIEKPFATLNELADYLIVEYRSWQGSLPYRYNLGSEGILPRNGRLEYNVVGFDFPELEWRDENGLVGPRQEMAREALKLYSQVLGITFEETSSSDAQFVFSDNESGAFSATSRRGFSGDTMSVADKTKVNIEKSWDGDSSEVGDYAWYTFLHEIGHGLGLGHSGPYNFSGGFDEAIFANDSWQLSMMSYIAQSQNPNVDASVAFPATPMVADWIALDRLYGEFGYGINNAFKGDTIYGYNTNIDAGDSFVWSQFVDIAINGASQLYGYGSSVGAAFTIVDGGGYNTLDLSGFDGGDQRIDLRPSDPNKTFAYTSDILGWRGNLTIAPNTFIHVAKGGLGNDIFIGNEMDNAFWGTQGSNIFWDSLGNNVYHGGDGLDSIYMPYDISQYSFRPGNDSIAIRCFEHGFTKTVFNSVDKFYFGASTLENYQNYSIALSYSELAALPLVNGGQASFSITGTRAVGEKLTIAVATADPDGNGTFSHSWQASADGSTWSGVGTGIELTIAQALEGQQLRVLTSYRDGQGFSETVTTAAGEIPFVNDGQASFSITGTRAVGEKLTIAVATADPDGNGTFSHSWQASADGSTWSGVGTGIELTIAQALEGQQLRVLTSYRDGQGFSETVTTAAGEIPFVNDGQASFSITGTRAVGEKLTIAVATADPDGNGTFSHSWQASADGSTWSGVGTGIELTIAQALEGQQLRVLTSYRDGQGFSETVTTAAGEIPFVNDGQASFSITGTRAVGEKLTIAVATADPDGNGTFSHSWQASADGSTWSGVGTGIELTIAQALEGQQLRVLTSYRDGQGFSETVTTAAGEIPFVNDGQASFSITGHPRCRREADHCCCHGRSRWQWNLLPQLAGFCRWEHLVRRRHWHRADHRPGPRRSAAPCADQLQGWSGLLGDGYHRRWRDSVCQ
jgi:hypothetical protein